MADFVQNLLQLHELIGKVGEMREDIEKAAEILAECVAYGGTIYVMGNGGSAADANHFSGEILGRFKKERKGLAAVSLAADNASITAIANDYGYEYIFQRQLEGLFDPLKDVVFTMTTSGNSKNIINALAYLDNVEGKSVNLLGRDGGKIEKFRKHYPSDRETNIIIPAQDSDRIQEMHKFILHYFAEVIEEKYIELKVN
jgi:D-sedoheptulose 7-phosphate isomerase